jgi:ArsR family transcriptional regulator
MKREKLTRISKVLKSIAHPDRLMILNLLGCSSALTVSEIKAATGLTQSMTSQHLISMKTRGVLVSSKKKNRVFYSISNKDVLKVISCMKKCG